MSISSKVRSLVSGRRKKPHMVVSKDRLPQKKACRIPSQQNSANEMGDEAEAYSLSLRIPRSGRHEIRLQDTTDDIGDVVRAAAQDDSLGPEAGGPDLSDDGVDDGADRHGVDAEPHDAEDGLDQAEGVGLGLDAGQDADEPQAAQQAVEAAEPDAPPAPLGDVEPRDDDTAEGDGGADEAEAVGEVGAQAGLLVDWDGTVSARARFIGMNGVFVQKVPV